MKTAAVKLDDSLVEKWSCSLYQDSNGNWFAEVQSDCSTFWTSTYTIAREAIDEAVIKTKGGAIHESPVQKMGISKEIELGDLARDNVTGFQGVVVAITQWLHGCDRICIQPQRLHENKVIEGITFDRLQMSLIKKSVIVATSVSTLQRPPVVRTGGPHPEPIGRGATKRSG